MRVSGCQFRGQRVGKRCVNGRLGRQVCLDLGWRDAVVRRSKCQSWLSGCSRTGELPNSPYPRAMGSLCRRFWVERCVGIGR